MFWCLSLSVKSAPLSLFTTFMSISMLFTSFLVTIHSTPLWSRFFYPRHADNVENRLTLKPKRLSARKMLGFSRLSTFSTWLRLQFINYCFSWGGIWHSLQAIPRINISPLKWDSPLLFDWGTMKSSSEKPRESANLKKLRRLQEQWEIPHNKSWLMF